MKITSRSRAAFAIIAATTLAVSLSACSKDSDTPAAPGSNAGGGVGVDLPRADSDFWNAYAKYVPAKAKDLGVTVTSTTNSQNDVQKLLTNVDSLVAQGAKALVMAPQDTGAIASKLDELAGKKIPVVSVDTRPDSGSVYMVVRADNRAYGTKACEFLGEKLGGKGKVIEFQGSLSSINGRDRSEAFKECMTKKFPDIKVFEEPTEWEGAKAQAALETRLTTDPDIKGVYMQAGGVFLDPTLQVLKQRGLLVPPSDPKHIFIISNDGIPQEFDAIRKGEIDATVSQPADTYAGIGLYWAKQALAGVTPKEGPTDHGSIVIKLPNGFEDQLPAPLVTKDNVDDASLWGNAKS
ncbi:simple sugar transport system substrate-binding protein/ribose transport system substrate-binding protein [Actinokineospora alba]|uniref:Simple sugar transport system substrate-binding protein/ribose transport system substrate-binding protein n=1 Tax=Actinokineospora alba TaxID=504798 RepID=A0A1H0ES79_9PSEU|nr:sugar ABC transporter substrate-binding protein [Actinokineospora alba]TDP69204.1 simple sugar transport system substrate-binding protein/ribose transport system substrate-binding protein [Actinokineospora alba]SDI21917.1 simple sugar transport system substrate-binding protein/ribose transport system substrate-binding protein [Actinokineospora alba]SDN85222.1 simple sugar transport system substrate-binding protein/ribose transport system substrate-binding protein [Actinokineospora alba]